MQLLRWEGLTFIAGQTRLARSSRHRACGNSGWPHGNSSDEQARADGGFGFDRPLPTDSLPAGR